jgi:hypothetical protein
MDPTISGIVNLIIAFLEVYILPYLVTLAVAFLSVGFAAWLIHRRNDSVLRKALRAELTTNSFISTSLLTYSENQLTSERSVEPMPRYHDSAYREYKRGGLLEGLKGESIEELENYYLYTESVNEAGRRQEDLAYGPSSAYPNAHQLRLENLTYIHDTVHNVIVPYFERLKDIRL